MILRNFKSCYRPVFLDDLNSLTFLSMFLILVGLFFATASLLDGYFFDDPINGYPWKKKSTAQNKYDDLVNSVTDLNDYSNSSFKELKENEMREKCE